MKSKEFKKELELLTVLGSYNVAINLISVIDEIMIAIFKGEIEITDIRDLIILDHMRQDCIAHLEYVKEYIETLLETSETEEP